jgi:hypothetical protein
MAWSFDIPAWFWANDVGASSTNVPKSGRETANGLFHIRFSLFLSAASWSQARTSQAESAAKHVIRLLA